jgi:SAM-dependent methyltransferase
MMDEKMNYTEINSKAIDRWVDDGWEWSRPITRKKYAEAKKGKWGVLLTPRKPVPHGWFAPYLQDGKLTSVKLLGLASGGGQQMPIFAALGADCTVLDYSEKMLANERMVSQREGYPINIVRADMSKRLPFDDETFDIIFHPVSNCYVEDAYHVWNECFRVLKKGGVLLAGMNYGIDYLVDDLTDDDNPRLIVNKLPYNPLRDSKLYEKILKSGEDDYQFSHTVEEQIGGQLKAGFTLTDLFEDTDGEGLGEYIPNYIATRAVKP